MLLGIVVFFYLTDRPRQAKWLTDSERTWLETTMAAEEDTSVGHGSLRDAIADIRVWALGLVYFSLSYGLFALSFFLPTIVAGFAKTFNTKYSVFETGLIVSVPFAIGAVAMVLYSRHSDRTGERVWHVAAAMLLAAVSIPVALYMNSPLMAMAVICLTAVGIFSAYPVFWYLPSSFLAGAGAAAGIALINTLGACSGLAAPYMTGFLLDVTGSSRAGLWVVGGVMLVGVLTLLPLRHSLGAADKTPPLIPLA